jgi:branched-chain amino acid transport system substrate-binding protein
MDITARNRIPFLQVIPTADTISEKIQSNPELYRHVFMFNIPASKIHYTLFDLIENVTKDAGFKDEEKTIAVFVDETDFGRTTGLTWEKWLTDLGWKVYLEIVPFQETEFSPMISKLVELKPTIVKTEFTALTSDTAFVQELYESPINPFQIYGLGQRLKEFGEIVPREMYLYSLNINEGYDLQELSKKFKGADPGFALGGYECIHIMAEAIERAGTLEADAIAESLLETDYQGWYQRTVFDPETHFARQGLEEYKFNCVIQYQEDADPIVWPEKAKQAEFIWPENFLEYRANK